MEANRPDAVWVEVSGNLVMIDNDERNRLLRKLRIVSGFDEIIAKFEAADPAAPVQLNLVERFRLRIALEVWHDNGELPEGLARLLDTIVQADPRDHHGKPHHAA